MAVEVYVLQKMDNKNGNYENKGVITSKDAAKKFLQTLENDKKLGCVEVWKLNEPSETSIFYLTAEDML